MLAFSMRKFFWGLAIMAIGGLFWANNFGLVDLSFRFSRDWPVIIVAVGLLSLWNALFGRQWWAHYFRSERRERRDKVLRVMEALERGNITVEEAVKRMSIR